MGEEALDLEARYLENYLFFSIVSNFYAVSLLSISMVSW